MKSFCGSPLNLFILSIKEMVTVWYSEVGSGFDHFDHQEQEKQQECCSDRPMI